MSKAVRITYGKHTYGAFKATSGIITVGNFCSIAAGVNVIILADHQKDWVTTYPFTKRWGTKDTGNPVVKQNPHVVVGNDVWIGQGAILLEDTVIGDGAIVGCYSVTHGEIPPYSIVVGNPARVTSKRFTENQIAALLRIQWWNWEDDKIKEFAPLLSSSDVDRFIKESENA